MMSGRHLAFPFHIAADGRSASPLSLDQHVRAEVIQLLLTNQGERPFLPSFGGGLRRLVFDRNDDVGAGLAKATITQALNNFLGHRVKVEQLAVVTEDATMMIELTYRVIATDQVSRVRFERNIGE